MGCQGPAIESRGSGPVKCRGARWRSCSNTKRRATGGACDHIVLKRKMRQLVRRCGDKFHDGEGIRGRILEEGHSDLIARRIRKRRTDHDGQPIEATGGRDR